MVHSQLTLGECEWLFVFIDYPSMLWCLLQGTTHLSLKAAGILLRNKWRKVDGWMDGV